MARPPSGRTGQATNIYLDQDLKEEARKVARERYQCSLSALVERLLKEEIRLKRGLVGRNAA